MMRPSGKHLLQATEKNRGLGGIFITFWMWVLTSYIPQFIKLSDIKELEMPKAMVIYVLFISLTD